MDSNEWKLWYERPAEDWVEALPIGNGRLGGMVFGGARHEHIQLNEDTLWSGYPRDSSAYEAKPYLEKVRALVAEGSYAMAQQMIEENMLGPWNDCYQAMGDLHIAFAGGDSFADYRRGDEPIHYRRELDLTTAVAATEFSLSGVSFKRESFVSAADQVMVIRLTADKPGKLNCQLSLSSPLNHAVYKAGADMIALSGQAPSYTEPYAYRVAEPVRYEENKGLTFGIELKAFIEEGHLEVTGGRMLISGASAVTLLLSAATSFNGFDRNPHPDAEGKDPLLACRRQLQEAEGYTYEELRSRHVADHSRLFSRMDLSLGDGGRSDLPTDERILKLREGQEDHSLAALFFQYGRYLLIASSRPGTQPATLQGIWNEMTRPPWQCNYTTNINVQMNYWHAEACNLSECHLPLFDMLDDLRITGAKMAMEDYGCRGWTAHHGVDLWRVAAPSGGPSKGPASWAFWPMAGPWLAQHPWEHYQFSKDKAFLAERAYPIMKEAALFCLDWLVEDQEGRLVTNPSTSPENTFIAPDGQRSAVSTSSTMDVALIRELFTNCIEAIGILEEDEAFGLELRHARAKLLPLRIGKHGQLQEWSEDFEEAEPGHRHTAHLYPLHPGQEISPRTTPALAEACLTTLRRRHAHEGEDAIGWCYAWMVNQYARLEDAQMAHSYLIKLLKNPYSNLFNAHRHPKLTFYPLTIEANFGGTAGIAEMLLQSHLNELHLLPALPDEWSSGYIRGLRARGGFEVEMEWKEGVLQRVSILSRSGEDCRVRTPMPMRLAGAACPSDPLPEGRGPEVLSFPTVPGKVYELYPLS